MRTHIFVFCLLCFAASQVLAAPLVKDGKPTGEFVLPDPAAGAELFATNDVRGWIEKITGAKVPILTSPSPHTNVKVLIGTAHAAEFDRDLARLKGNDGFAVRCTGSHVHVFGSRPRWTLHGLYAFLEKNTDLIFARPHEEFGTVFGKTPDFELAETLRRLVLSKEPFLIRRLARLQ